MSGTIARPPTFMNMAGATLFNLLSNGVFGKEIPPFRFRINDRASRRTATFTWRSVRRGKKNSHLLVRRLTLIAHPAAAEYRRGLFPGIDRSKQETGPLSARLGGT